MGIMKGFAILAEEKTKVVSELISFLEKREKELDEIYDIVPEGKNPNEWFVKNSNFRNKGKGDLKLFIEVSFRNRMFKYEGKWTPYDYMTFNELNKIIDKHGANNLYLFPFQVNSGIRKTKPDRMLKAWKGKLI